MAVRCRLHFCLGLFVLAMCAGVVDGSAKVATQKITDEKLAVEWTRELEPLMEKFYSEHMFALWSFQTNITEESRQLHLEASLRLSQFRNDTYKNTTFFDWRNFKDSKLRRMFSLLSDVGFAQLSFTDVNRANTLQSDMQSVYSKAQLCKDTKGNKTCYQLEPGLTRIMAESRDWDELVWAWRGWRDVTGKTMLKDYKEFVGLLNKAASMNDLNDYGEYWRSWYEIPDLEGVCMRLWEQVKPLYQQLHAYVRRKLMQQYKGHLEHFPKSRHIPAHLLGNMWSQTWANIFDLVAPFKNKTSTDVTQALRDQRYNATTMFRMADEFFTSLGLEPMPRAFWAHSLLEKPKDGRQVVCHASAWDFSNGKDFRIKQCTDITDEDLGTTHHEMGHVQYYLNYKHQPIVFREGANPGFHEAVGDVISRSVVTPEHLHKIGLLDVISNDTEADINFLMQQALLKVAFLPFGFLIDLWRYGVFDGTTTQATYNRDWWKLRCKLQGVSPPVDRQSRDFDPGAKFHVSSNTPYIRYFVSNIIQFQFHEALCKAAGNQRPLHRCDIYQSKAAGNKLREMLRLGSSKPWPDAMEVLTGQREFDARPLLAYFKPLQDWLQLENAGYDVTWEEECPNPVSDSALTSAARKLVFVAMVMAIWFKLN